MSQELRAVRHAALLAAAHVELRRGNHLVALRYAQALLADPDAAAAARAAAHEQVAEALACGGALPEALAQVVAAQELAPKVVRQSESSSESPAGDTGRTVPDAAADAAAAGRQARQEVNAAVAAMQGGAAQQAEGGIQKALALQPGLCQAQLAALQGQLLGGDTAAALQMLRPSQQHGFGMAQH